MWKYETTSVTGELYVDISCREFLSWAIKVMCDPKLTVWYTYRPLFRVDSLNSAYWKIRSNIATAKLQKYAQGLPWKHIRLKLNYKSNLKILIIHQMFDRLKFTANCCIIFSVYLTYDYWIKSVLGQLNFCNRTIWVRYFCKKCFKMRRF